MKTILKFILCVNSLGVISLESSAEDVFPAREQMGVEKNVNEQRRRSYESVMQDYSMSKKPTIIRGIKHADIARSLMPVVMGVPSPGSIAYEKDDEILSQVRASGSGDQYYARKIAGGTLLTAAWSGTGYFKFAVYVVKTSQMKMEVLPVTRIEAFKEIGLLVPGLDLISVVEVDEEGLTVRGRVLKSDEKGPFEVQHIHGFKRIRPVPLPDNEDTEVRRGVVRTGYEMTLAKKRLAEIPPGTLAHPPEGSSWSSFWVYGDGLLAVEVDPATNVIRKLAYVLGPAGESPVFLPLNRIHLTDGEMFMPIPPPPGPKDSSTTGDNAPDHNP